MTTAEIKARSIIAMRTTRDLIKDFETTEKAPMTPELPTVRGWIMDELQKRDSKAFEAWIDSEEESPRRFFKAPLNSMCNRCKRLHNDCDGTTFKGWTGCASRRI